MFKMMFPKLFKSADHYSARIRKIDKVFVRKRNFKDVKYPVKIRHIHKI